ncbi:unnamed protein product [Gordionus sp. m RMFG-2023]
MYVDLIYINQSIDITYGILMPSLITLGLVGNFIYFWCLYKNKKSNNRYLTTTHSNPKSFVQCKNSTSNNVNSSEKRQPYVSPSLTKQNIYLYIKTLAISDLLICVNSIMVPTTYVACYHTCRRSYIFSFYSIKIGFPLMDVFTNFSYILRVFVSLDRLWALMFPFTYRNMMCNSFIKYLMILGFIASFLMTIPYSWGYNVIADKEIQSSPIPYNNNWLYANNTLPENVDLNFTDSKCISEGNNLNPCLKKKYVVIYTHSRNPKAWFVRYRKWTNFIMSFVPFMVSSIANFFIILKCYTILHNRIDLKVNRKIFINNDLRILIKPLRISKGMHSRIQYNAEKVIIKNDRLPAMRKREFKITILMLAINVHFVFSTIPMTLYMLIYQPRTDTFSTKTELWFQNIAYLTKYGNNALSVYITLFFDSTIRNVICKIIRWHRCF